MQKAAPVNVDPESHNEHVKSDLALIHMSVGSWILRSLNSYIFCLENMSEYFHSRNI